MKTLVTGLVLGLSLSFSALADSRVVDVADLGACGGVVELRSYMNQGEERFALQFVGVHSCSNVRLSTGKSYKLTDRNGNFMEKNITLSNDAIAEAQSYRGLGMLVESNSGSTAVEVSVEIAPAPSYPSRPTTYPTSPAPAPTSW